MTSIHKLFFFQKGSSVANQVSSSFQLWGLTAGVVNFLANHMNTSAEQFLNNCVTVMRSVCLYTGELLLYVDPFYLYFCVQIPNSICESFDPRARIKFKTEIKHYISIVCVGLPQIVLNMPLLTCWLAQFVTLHDIVCMYIIVYFSNILLCTKILC